MGKNDSSKTRVVPFMDFLNKDISKINLFLEKCLNTKVLLSSTFIAEYRYGKKSMGNPGEMALPAQPTLLKWYINHSSELDQSQNVKKKGSPKDSTIIARKEFFEGNEYRKQEALIAINKLFAKQYPSYGRDWCYFEGYTNPDIYIETESEILIGEAKRTESHLTNKVTWYKKRDQLLRHVDSIIGTKRAAGKKIYSFLILDKENEGTLRDVKDYPSEQVLKDSLPHLNYEEQNQIKNTYLGYTTWQDISDKLGIVFQN